MAQGKHASLSAIRLDRCLDGIRPAPFALLALGDDLKKACGFRASLPVLWLVALETVLAWYAQQTLAYSLVHPCN